MQLSIDEKLACLYECIFRIGENKDGHYIGICVALINCVYEICEKKYPYKYPIFPIHNEFPTLLNYKPDYASTCGFWWSRDDEGSSQRILLLLAMADELEDQKLH